LQIRFAKNRDPEPLFILDLNLKKGQIIPQYSTDPKDIVTKIMDVFDEGIKCLQAIPQLEPILLKHLFKTHKKTLKAPQIPPQKPQLPDPAKKNILPDENTWLWEAFDQIKSELERQITPLYDYVQTFKQFEPESKLNPDQFVKALDDREGGISPEELKYDIQLHREEEDKLKMKIPEQIVVGIFAINCKDIRSFYAGKHTQIVDKEIKLIAQKAKEMNYEITTKFDEINERIKRPPKDIQELTETKKYIAEIGIEIEKKKKDIDYCMGIYAMLDEENFEFTSNEQDQKWQLYGCPKMIMSTIEEQNQILEKTKEQFIKDMEEAQVEFEDTLDNLAITTGGFHEFNDIKKFEEIANDVESVNQRIAENIAQAKLFNTQEFLVGKEQKDYSRLDQMAKQFKPYSDLWLTIRKWFNSHESWMNDPWEQLDAEDLQDTFDNSKKTIGQVFNKFKNSEH